MTNHLWVYGIIGEAPKGATDKYYSFKNLLEDLDPAADDYTVHIYSPGGDVFEGQAIYNALKNTGKNIKVLIEGVCASIATLIAATASPGMLYMNSNSQFMVHPPKFNNISGDENQLRTGADQLAQIKTLLVSVYRKRTGLPEEKVREMVNTETWMLPEVAKNLGFVDEVVESMKAVAYADYKPNNMEDKNTILAAIENLGKKISGYWKPKNESTTLADGSVITVATEDGDWTGKQVTREDGSPLEPGEYPLTDGRILVVGDGSTIAEVRETAAEDKAQDTENSDDMQYKEKFEAAEARIKELESALQATSDTKAQTEAKVKSLENKINVDMKALSEELNKIKNTTAGDQSAPVKATSPVSSGAPSEDPMKAWYKKHIFDVRNTD